MKKPRLIASAKPNYQKVKVGRKIFVYHKIRIKTPTPMQCCLDLMHKIAKITLRRVKQIANEKTKEDGIH